MLISYILTRGCHWLCARPPCSSRAPCDSSTEHCSQLLETLQIGRLEPGRCAEMDEDLLQAHSSCCYQCCVVQPFQTPPTLGAIKVLFLSIPLTQSSFKSNRTSHPARALLPPPYIYPSAVSSCRSRASRKEKNSRAVPASVSA
jgi:hypothetical protein